MSTKPPTRHDSSASNRGNDPRANYIHLGTDTEDAHHVYRTVDETIIVVDTQGRREHVQQLDGRSAHEWMAHVADVRGWTTQYLVESFGEFLDQAAQGGED